MQYPMKQLKKIRTFVAANQMLERGDRVLIGFSGGADSVYLCLVLLALQKELDLTLGAIHVNHQIRGEEAKRDAAWSRSFCESHGIFFYEVSYPVPELARNRGQSEEETGREVRREAFARCANENAYKKIALAHHGTDLAETMLHHMARGTSLTGLTSLRPVRGNLIRPLLCISGEQIRSELAEIGQEWREDSTNREDAYTRNRIRHQILPLFTEQVNSGAVTHMADLAMDLVEVETYLERQTRELFSRYVKCEEGFFLVSRELLREPEFLALRLLTLVLKECSGKEKDLGRVHAKSLLLLLQGPVAKKLSLPYGLRAEQTTEGLALTELEKDKDRSKEERITDEAEGQKDFSLCFSSCPEGSFPLPGGAVVRFTPTRKKEEKKYTKTIPYDKIKDGFTLRTRQSGDYLRINADGNHKLLKRYFIDAHVPREEREEQLLLCRGNEVLWVVGRRCGWMSPSDEGAEYVRISFEGGKYHE